MEHEWDFKLLGPSYTPKKIRKLCFLRQDTHNTDNRTYDVQEHMSPG